MTHLLRFLRGLTALALVLGIVIGTPVLLLRIGRLPSSGALSDLFAPDNGQLLLLALTVLGWLAWGVFAASVVLEILVLLSGQRLRVRVPGLGAPRGIAAGLLLSIAAMVPVSAHAQPVATPPAEAPQTQDRIAEEESATDKEGPAKGNARKPASDEENRSARKQDQGGLRYTVRRGDDLWSIAERFYGDGLAWSRIVAANPMIAAPDQIDVGWELILPGLEPPSPATETEAPSGVRQSTVEPAADARVDQDGSTSASADDRARDAGAPAPAAAGSAQDAHPSDVMDLLAYVTAGISSLTAAALLALLATRRANQLASRETGRRIVHPAPSAQRLEAALGRVQDPLSLRTLDLALRALGRHYREAGQRLPALGIVLVESQAIILEVDRVPDRIPPDFHADHRRLWVGAPEAESLAAQADDLASEPSPYPALVCLGKASEESLLLVDLESLGTMGLTGPPLAVDGVLDSLLLELSSSWWGRGQSIAVVDGDSELVAALDDPSVRVAEDLDSLLDDLEAETRRRTPARPDAHPRDVRCESDFTDAWRPHVILVCRRLSPPERDRVIALAPDVVVVAADGDLPGARIMPGPARSRLPSGHTFQAQAMSRRSRNELVELLRTTTTAATTPASWWSAVWEARAGEGEPWAAVRAQADLPAADDEDVPARPSAEESAEIEQTSESSAGTAPARSAGIARPAFAPSNWTSDGATILSLAARRAANHFEEPAVDSHEPVLHPDQPTLLLLGPVELLGARGERPTRAVRQCLEYVAWLLENPGATASMMSNALFVAEGTRRSNMSRLRTWLGTDADGERHLPEAYSGRIQLHPEVTSDWNRIQLLTIGGVNRATDANLVTVLELVRGAPLADAAPGQWHWAEELRTDMSSLIRDVGLVACERALGRGDVDGARWAVNRALVAAPEDERLLVARVRTEHRAGNRSEVERLALRLVRSARKLNVDLAEDTVTLLQEVMEGQPRARGLG